MQRALRVAELLAQQLEGGRVVVVAIDVAQQRDELREGRFVDPAAVLGEARAHARAQLLEVAPARETPTTGTSRCPRRSIA